MKKVKLSTKTTLPFLVQRREDIAIVKLVNDDIEITTESLCKFLNITKMALSNWANEGCPKLKRGWWSLRDVLEWRESQGRGINKELETDESHDLKQRKLRVEIELKEMQRDYTEIKKQITNGDFLDREIVTSELKRFMVIFKRSLLGIPRLISSQLGLRLEASECRKLEQELELMIKDILSQMSIDGTFKKPKVKK